MSTPLSLTIIKAISVLLIFFTALVAGIYPFFKKWRKGETRFVIGEALASGVFLGAGLIHMLGDASADFISLKFDYPLAFFIAGSVFLIFLAFEHLGYDFYSKRKSSSVGFVFIAFIMLSVHSLFAGAALGLSTNLTVVIVLLSAILAHKWAASFALATKIVQSDVTKLTSYILFSIFCLMTPLGIYFGNLVSVKLNHYPLVEPIFNSIAAGTFLYLGTMHGLSNSFMADECRSFKSFIYVILGFLLMAVVAIWT